ncbi:hypothetical protein A3B60_01770 [Candidatus Peregrinibacteria bacterium RIFCSPLOWO2_01_FULL_39_12]|nr:MAG: hypothetical protein A3I58_01925 [Candidatus Peregrinibacteria bacterium RIFCSPLOWO2_02_FULL_39_10]OGJ43156.1 MAG: hypothetical protein A3B60_01770 [Candidatus Peregrinibacteria bacterium RIFCSPLOWO2_01_FULL_39_12]
MKKFLALLIVSLSLFLFGCGGEDAVKEESSVVDVKYKGEEFVSEDGNFKINFPKEPEVSTSTVPTEVGDIAMYTFMYEESVTKVYLVSYAEYPTELMKSADSKELLKGSKDGQVANLGEGAKVDEEKEITIGKYPGTYFKANGGGFYVAAKNYLVGNRLYQLVIMRDGSYPSDEDVKGFLDTFELLEVS